MNKTVNGFESGAALAGRALIALIFLRSAAEKIGNFGGTAAMMAAKGMPYVEFLLACTIVLELVAGVLLVLGWKIRWAAGALIVFLVPATLIFHNYWAADAAQLANQSNHFYKNVAILGSLIFLAAVGAGPLSVDHRRRSSS